MKQEDIIQKQIEEYNQTLRKRASKKDEIAEMKRKLANLESECSELEMQGQEIENAMQAELYRKYSEKDLLKMISGVEKYAKKGVASDFKNLVEKFKTHDLGVNDITQLQSYIKLYGKYVESETGLIRGLFKALGGKTNG